MIDVHVKQDDHGLPYVTDQYDNVIPCRAFYIYAGVEQRPSIQIELALMKLGVLNFDADEVIWMGLEDIPSDVLRGELERRGEDV